MRALPLAFRIEAAALAQALEILERAMELAPRAHARRGRVSSGTFWPSSTLSYENEMNGIGQRRSRANQRFRC
jgi:hypothetical protein